MILADALAPTYVIDARIVGVVLTLFTVAIVPLVKWLATVTAHAAIEKVDGIGRRTEEFGEVAKDALARTEAHGRKIAEIESVAQSAHRNAEKVDGAVRALEQTAGRLDERIKNLDDDSRRLNQWKDEFVRFVGEKRNG